MRLKKHIPNAITSMNLLSGVFGVIVALQGRIDQAFLFMLAAAVLDFCDGFAARLLHATSPIGKELDSLADVVSFGVLPSVVLYRLMNSQVHGWLAFLPLVLAVFSALRLAKFNLDERQHATFLGLPTPASAMICGSLAYHVFHGPSTVLARLCGTPWFIPAVAIALSFLLVSEIPMFSLKPAKEDPVAGFKRTAFFSVAVIIAVLVAVLRLDWSVIVLTTFTAYVLMNLVFACFKATK